MREKQDVVDTMITLTTGKIDRGTRATLAFAWGCAALAMGKQVSIFLTMEGTVWAYKGAMNEVEVGGFEPLINYLEQFIELNGEVLVCAPCSQYYCSFDKETNNSKFIPESKLTGMATVVSKCAETTKVITF